MGSSIIRTVFLILFFLDTIAIILFFKIYIVIWKKYMNYKMKAPSSHKTLKQIEGSHKPPAQNQLDDISINIGVGVSLCL